MPIILHDESKGLQALFSSKHLEGEGEVAKKCISPSKLWCEVQEAFRLQGIPMEAEDRNFESFGYKESGNARHKEIQKFLKNHPDVEWIEPEDYIKEFGLPFVASYSDRVMDLVRKHPDISVKEAREILEDYETGLSHTTQPLSLKLDGIIKWKGIYYILEIKTIGKREFEKVPLDKHQPQGIVYSFLMKIENILWVYENREDFKIKAIVQKVREEEHQRIRNKLNRIIKHRDDVTLLERNLGRCNYCRYEKHCQEVFSSAEPVETVF